MPLISISTMPDGVAGDGAGSLSAATTGTKEAHKEGNGGWVLRLRCASEGTDSDETLHWRLGQDGRLRETQNGQTVTYVRCVKMTR